MTSPTRRALDARRTPCRTGCPRPQAPACCHAHHDRAGCASSIRSSCPGSVTADAGPRLRDHDHEPEREAPVPIDDRVQQVINGRRGRCLEASLLATARRPVLRVSIRRSCTGLLPTRQLPRLPPPVAARPPENLARARSNPRSSRPAFRGCRVPALVKTSPAGRIRQGPSMYEMEGPCPASPHQVSQLVACRRRAPPAGARYPREGLVSRLLPRSRVAPGGARFQR